VLFSALVCVVVAASPSSWGQSGKTDRQQRAAEAALLGLEAQKAVATALDDADAGGLTTTARPADGGVLDAGVAVVGDGGPRAPATGLDALLRKQAVERERAERAAEEATATHEAALRRAQQAKSKADEVVEHAIADVEAAKAKLAQADTQLHHDVMQALRHAKEQQSRARRALQKAKEKKAGTADAMLTDTISEQRTSLQKTRAAMAARRASRSSLTPTYSRLSNDELVRLRLPLNDDDRARLQKRVSALRALEDDVDRKASSLATSASENWYQVAQARLQVAKDQNESRLTLLPKVSPERRRALTGLTEEGRDNLVVAVEHLATQAHFHVQRRMHDAVLLPHRLQDPLFSSALAWRLFVLLVIFVLGTSLWRRAPKLYDAARKWMLSHMGNRARKDLLKSVLAILEDIAPQALLLLLALWALDVLGRMAPEPESQALLSLLLWVWIYQVTAKWTHRLVLRLARKRHSLTVPVKLKILRTVRSVLRLGFFSAFALTTTQQVVGAGVLFLLMRTLLAVVAGLLLLVLVRRWREEIHQSFVGRWPDNPLGQQLVKSEKGWLHLPLLVVALLAIAVRASTLLARDFVLGFEQSRKALAYFFQIRVERQAKERGRRVVTTSSLPQELQDAFADAPCENPKFLVDRAKEQPALVQRLREGRPLSIMVSAPAGGGVTTWLRLLQTQLEDVLVVDATPKERWRTRRDTVVGVAKALGLLDDDEGRTPSSIVDAIKQQSQPVLFVVDNIEQTFLRGLDGYEALNALLEIMSETEFIASWVVGGRKSAVRFLDKTRSLGASFDRNIELAPWTEKEIRDLVQKRQRICQLPLNFDDLLVRDLDDDQHDDLETEKGYLRLMWNFASGNPRTTLYFWLRSLVLQGDSLRVQLHDAPSPDDLEELGVNERFLLQASVLHRALTPADMARACHLPEGRTRVHVARGNEAGIYAFHDDNTVSITPHYWHAAVRFLRRKNLL